VRLFVEALEDRFLLTTTTLSALPNTSGIFGVVDDFGSFTMSARVVDDAGTPVGVGEVTFTVTLGGQQVIPPITRREEGTLLNGIQNAGVVQATFNTDPTLPNAIPPGPDPYVLTASYGQGLGDSSDSVSFLEEERTTTRLDLDTTTVPFGTAVTARASVGPWTNSLLNEAPNGGDVLFLVDGREAGSSSVDEFGHAQATLTDLQPGTHQIQAEYLGSVLVGPAIGVPGGVVAGTVPAASSISDPVAVTVQSATTTTLSSSALPSPPGAPVTFTAAVGTPLPKQPPLTGTVTFTIDSNPVASLPLDDNNRVSFTPSTLAPGSHTVTASYDGSDGFVPSASSSLDEVIQQTTTTTLQADPTSSTSGLPVTLTATVVPGGPLANSMAAPTGSVTFLDGITPLATIGLTGDQAMLTLPTLALGDHHFSADYGGDTFFAASQSGDVPQTVNPAATTTSLDLSPQDPVFGQPAQITATVTTQVTGATAPQGQVDLFIDGAATGTPTLSGTLDNGVVTFAADLEPGPHQIIAVYDGSPTDTTSTSAPLDFRVERAATQTTLGVSPGAALVGQPVTLTATVRTVAPGSGTPTGSVTFFADGGPLGSGALDSSGNAVLDTTVLAAGWHTLTAVYSGDGHFTGGTAAAVAAQIYPVPVLDVTGRVRVTFRRLHRPGHRVRVLVNVQNIGATPILGPIVLVLWEGGVPVLAVLLPGGVPVLAPGATVSTELLLPGSVGKGLPVVPVVLAGPGVK
jgi:hypothetical protein